MELAQRGLRFSLSPSWNTKPLPEGGHLGYWNVGIGVVQKRGGRAKPVGSVGGQHRDYTAAYDTCVRIDRALQVIGWHGAEVRP